jgi:hypothetical protein
MLYMLWWTQPNLLQQMKYLDRPQRSLLDVLAEQQAKLDKLPLNHPDRDKIALRIINLDGEIERRPNRAEH